jgi:hypothetical protein
MTRARMALAAPVAVALALYLSLALYQLDLPGLHYDEAREAGLPAVQLLRGLPGEVHRGATVPVLGHDVPLMVQDYIGALQVVLALPFLALLGPSATALRLLPVTLGALTIVLTGRLAQRLYGPRSAALAMLLLAVQPSFVFDTPGRVRYVRDGAIGRRAIAATGPRPRGRPRWGARLLSPAWVSTPSCCSSG